MIRCVFIVFNALLHLLVRCGPVPIKDIPSVEAFDFMRKFGYIPDDDGDSAALFTDTGLEEVIKEIQKFGALEQTGKLDNQTLALMKQPRCGVPDVLRHRPHRAKRFVLGPKGWNKRNITFFIANWSGKLSEQIVDKYIRQGLDSWGRYGRLNFERVYSPDADIIVAFGRGYHGDTYPFDGPGNILAHAFFPYEYESLGGDIHFDDDENWTIEEDVNKGTNFFQVAIHELGHSLGLSHSPVPSSVMFPYYVGNGPNALDYDDILGMYELYIKRRLESDIQSTSTSTTDYSENSSEFDYSSSTTPAATSQTSRWTTMSTITYPSTTSPPPLSTTSPRTELTVSSSWFYPNLPSTRRYYASTIRPKWTTTSPAPSTSSPSITNNPATEITYYGDTETVDDHKVHDPTHKIPPPSIPSFLDICTGDYDAVATLRNEIFVFKNEYLWRLRSEYDPVPGYPIPFRQMFPKLPKTVRRIHAAYQRPDGQILLFTGKSYWVYDGTFFIENSPKPLTDLGLPETLEAIDAVQNWARNGKTYFYRGNMFWRYNETSKIMDEGYPRRMDRWRGVPSYLDAATTWKGVTYFFKGLCYWKFDNDWINITESSPMPTAQAWFGCPQEEVEHCVPSNLVD